MSNQEFFPNIKKIEYKPDAQVYETMVFRHYNENELVLGKPMKEWLRFAVCYWHTFCWEGSDPFGKNTLDRYFVLSRNIGG